MATVSNPATLQSVINTFGSGGSPTNLFAYRRGQSYVPDIPAYSGVSTTQPALSTFAGLTYPFLDLPAYGDVSGIVLDRNSTVIPPGVGTFVTTFVRIRLNSDGTGAYTFEDYFTAETNFTSFTWLLAGTNSDYYAYMDSPSGDPFFSGSTATSLQLSTTRVWVLRARASQGNTDFKSLTSTLRIKNASGTDLTSRQVTMTASSDNGSA